MWKRKNINRFLFATLFSFCGHLFFGGIVHAFDILPTPNVVVDGTFPVGPAKFELDTKPGETHLEVIFVQNRFGKERSFKVEVEDFQGSLNNPQQTVILQGANDGEYGARAWLQPDAWEFTLEHGDRARIIVAVRVPEDADPGDHYASFLVTALPDEEPTAEALDKTQPNIQVLSRVGVNFLINVEGEVQKSGQLESLESYRSWYEHAPIEFRTVFRNEGTVRLTPQGEGVITNMFGTTIDTIPINSYDVLRNSVRGMSYSWQPKNVFLIGKYTFSLTIHRGYNDVIDTKSVSFWVIPWKMLSAVIVIFVLLIVLLRYLQKKIKIEVQ